MTLATGGGMTDRITTTRALLEQALEALEAMQSYAKQECKGLRICDEAVDAIRAEMAKPVEQVEQNWNRSIRDSVDALLAEAGYQPDSSARHQLAMMNFDQKAQTTPAWHDAPEVAALKAERDELLKRRKIHPHDIPLEIFLADLSTRTANVLRAEFDSLKHTGGIYGFESPFTVRHVLMFSRKEIKKWPGIGKKGLNEIEENLRARGLQLWHAHDDRSLRLLREHKSYFAAIGDKDELGAFKPDRDAMEKDAERYRWLAAHARKTSEHWGGRWSIVIDGPAPKSHDSEDDFDEAIDAAIAKAEGGAA